jgi:hypothetical protein
MPSLHIHELQLLNRAKRRQTIKDICAHFNESVSGQGSCGGSLWYVRSLERVPTWRLVRIKVGSGKLFEPCICCGDPSEGI